MSMFTTQHYEAIAETFKKQRQSPYFNDSWDFACWYQTLQFMAQMFADDNPNFDVFRFYDHTMEVK